jgi:hypothetical protein
MSLGGSQYRQAIDSLMKAKPHQVAGSDVVSVVHDS